MLKANSKNQHSKMKAAIITEGYQGTGYGHLTRCLSIYQAFEEKGIQPLYIANCDEEGKKFIPNVNLLQINWLEKSSELVDQIKDYDIAVIDSYLAPIEIYEEIFNTVKKVVYIDDFIRLDYPPGIIVNGTIGAENLPYKKDEKHEYLLGIEYMPLRKEFWDVDLPKRENREIKNILITFGAQDLRKLTTKVLSFLYNEFPKMNYYVVVSNSFEPEFERDNIIYFNSLNAEEMLHVMLKSDLAIVAAGQTTYELARVGLPMIAIGIAENQRNNIKGWISKTTLNEEIWYNDKDILIKIGRNIKIEAGKVKTNVVDGYGSKRIVLNTLDQNHLFEINDYKFNSFINLDYHSLLKVLSWRNNPIIKNYFITLEDISITDHLAFVKKLFEQNTKYYWLIEKQKEYGIVYLYDINKKDKTAFWGFYLQPKFLGTGKALDIEFISLTVFFNHFKLKNIFAVIHKENKQNLRLQKFFKFEVVDGNKDSKYFTVQLTKENWEKLPKNIISFKRSLLNAK